mmetsp:Transcript_2014/g.5075  ORF Transcript_2014/g.5075 Transcript_2014/m.5075 type:complete len:231 (+) Transcript_2014:1780-2472(+)
MAPLGLRLRNPQSWSNKFSTPSPFPTSRASQKPPEPSKTKPGVFAKDILRMSGCPTMPNSRANESPNARVTSNPGVLLPAAKMRFMPLSGGTSLSSARCPCTRLNSVACATVCAGITISTFCWSSVTVATRARESPNQPTCTSAWSLSATVQVVPEAEKSSLCSCSNSLRSEQADSNPLSNACSGIPAGNLVTSPSNPIESKAPMTNIGMLCATRKAARCPNGPWPSHTT